MVQVARLAPKLLESSTSLVVDFFHSQRQPDGGFCDRDGRSDLYSAGIVFYELVVGQPPFTADEADGPFTLMAKHVQAPPKPPSVLKPGLDLRLEERAVGGRGEAVLHPQRDRSGRFRFPPCRRRPLTCP